MTIKTLLLSDNRNIETRRKSDMQKRGAVRNLFNTTVDRDELQEQVVRMENDNLKTLQSYKLESRILKEESANGETVRKPKKFPRFLDADDSEDEAAAPPPRITRERIESDEASSSADQEKQSLSSTSQKSSDLKLIVSTQIPLPRGQKTLKGEKILLSSYIFKANKMRKKKCLEKKFFCIDFFV